jgi:glucokinase
VAIDLGGTSMKGALVAADGAVLARVDAPTPAAAGGAAVLAAVVDLARTLAAADRSARVVGAAAVTPGQVHGGVVRFAANLGWRDVPLAAELSAALGVPAAVEHDAAGAALAEASYGNRSGDCLFVALGTGIGAGHVRDGRVAAGSTGGAGELGHIPVYPDGEPCACGQRGCLEVYASAAAVARRYAAGVVAGGRGAGDAAGRAIDGGAGPGGADAVDVGAGPGGADAVDVGAGPAGADAVVARIATDPVARAVWAQAVDALALALATTILLVDPGVIVLGGGLARAGDALLEPLSAALAGRLAWRSPPPLELSVLGTDAGWRGASLLAWSVAESVAESESVPEPPVGAVR